MLYQNNPTPNFTIANPLQKTIEEGEDIITQLRDLSSHLEACIADERGWYSRYKEVLDAYDAAEIEALSEAIIMAQAKEGPLGGLAATSKAYDIALTKLKNDLRKGFLSQQWQAADRIRRSYELAKVDLEQAEARFKALRAVAEVKTQILRASTI